MSPRTAADAPRLARGRWAWRYVLAVGSVGAGLGVRAGLEVWSGRGLPAYRW